MRCSYWPLVRVRLNIVPVIYLLVEAIKELRVSVDPDEDC
jgi:hypothetical protein